MLSSVCRLRLRCLPLRRLSLPPARQHSIARVAAFCATYQPQRHQARSANTAHSRLLSTQSAAKSKRPPASPRPRYTPPSTLNMASSYSFPDNCLATLKDTSRTPLILLSCGSFSPITYLHLRMFEMVNDWVHDNTNFEVVGGYLSPVADAYKKDGLAQADHRVEMCRLAAQASWIMVDDWEAIKSEYTPTAQVLDHFAYEINTVRGGIADASGNRHSARIALIAGADLILTFGTPGVWAPEDLDHILAKYGTFIVERTGASMDEALALLSKWRSEIYIIPQFIQNDISSTKIRHLLKKGNSVRYLVPDKSLEYINHHGLFRPGNK